MQKNYRPSGTGLFDAAPGTYLVSAYFDDNEADLIYCNVLGWQVNQDRTLTPMVLDPRAADEKPWYVLHPDGRVESSDGRSWPGKDAWLTDARKAWRAAA